MGAQSKDFFSSEVALFAMMQDLGLDSNSEAQIQSLQVVAENQIDRVRLTLQFPKLPVIRLYLSGPHNFLNSEKALNTVFVMAGFLTGAENTLLLGEIKDTVVISYDYPFSPQQVLKDPGVLIQISRTTPGQAALALKWISKQTWTSLKKTSCLGVSLGGLFLPASLRMAGQLGIEVPNSVFAFTGSSVKDILNFNLLTTMDSTSAAQLAEVLSALALFAEPKLHLPFLKGRFLVLRSNQDSVFPSSSTDQLLDLLPNPKTQICFQGGHVNADQKELIEKTKSSMAHWLQADLPSNSCSKAF